jgi:SAM-dependent methyltransferase
MTDGLAERVEREKAAYDQGLKRGGYHALLSHVPHYYKARRNEILRETFRDAPRERYLELGSYAWVDWIDGNGIQPKSLVCINISETEIEKGRKHAAHTHVQPDFALMDAHHLDFPDGSFDVVFGADILHHLQMPDVLDEIARVLAPGGRAVFLEPLATNPVGMAVRAATPWARTVDEQPFRRQELRALRERFDCVFHFEQFMSVPAGVVSRFVAKTPENGLMRLAFKLDEGLKKGMPALGALYRKVLVVGTKAS